MGSFPETYKVGKSSFVDFFRNAVVDLRALEGASAVI